MGYFHFRVSFRDTVDTLCAEHADECIESENLDATIEDKWSVRKHEYQEGCAMCQYEPEVKRGRPPVSNVEQASISPKDGDW